ncbi:50S ribosomal protein L29 [Candidatus Daviesbacteria bacterium RIFCSPLOWO2_01_FULL_39_12]|uniref:Large ribosomal subunit protein uL29 n=1 Tax=Candidatus Daviesbacteria bacterium RIFCSPLOWO2_01_FULL_39_12 TaxID=1797785 RepID=A0A1F5KLJ1_9BACT|nr:MAG: 50S ribosomal protein L29 [Candidatus Daviesbacteria bacterium RIFCSPHIGHO2_02_FULL_39_8]OGE41699.1 MAG: 50S ribosomal protein L29 [Candidatus Daviesbacteria bacterium RIFCSPLOWO2_01_FULL_39_12]
MKKSELAQVKGLDIKELKNKAKSLRDEVANLVIDKNTNKLKDKKAIFKKRKDLAKVLTVLRQKELLNELETKTGGMK